MKQESLNMVEINACGNQKAEKKLSFPGKMSDRIRALILETVFSKGDWDLISVREVPWNILSDLQTDMKIYGYDMYMHPLWKSVKRKACYTCLSALFVKDNTAFTQIVTSDRFETVLRYVAGKIEIAGTEVVVKTSHIPCVDESRPDRKHQIRRKTDMLEDELWFQRKYQYHPAISSGDFNGGAGGNWYGRELYDQFLFYDVIRGSTYADRQLDHVYISEGLKNSGISVKTEVLEDGYMELTDHKVISVKLAVKQQNKSISP